LPEFHVYPAKSLHTWFVSFDEELCEDEDYKNGKPYQVICYRVTNDQIDKIVRVENSVWEKRKVD